MRQANQIQQMFLDSFEAEKRLRRLSETINHQIKDQLAILLVHSAKDTTFFEGTQPEKELLWLSRSLSFLNVGIRKDFKLTDISAICLQQLAEREPEFLDKKIKLNIEVESNSSLFADPFSIIHAFNSLFRGIQYSLVSSGHLNFKMEEKSNELILRASWNEIDSISTFASLCFETAEFIFESHGGALKVQHTSQPMALWELNLPLQKQSEKAPPFYLEKRRFPRVWVDLAAQVGPDQHVGQIRVLSEGGALVELHAGATSKLEIGDSLSLKIAIPPRGLFELGKVRVADVKLRSEQLHLGVEFGQLDQNMKNLLAALVKVHAS